MRSSGGTVVVAVAGVVLIAIVVLGVVALSGGSGEAGSGRASGSADGKTGSPAQTTTQQSRQQTSPEDPSILIAGQSPSQEDPPKEAPPPPREPASPPEDSGGQAPEGSPDGSENPSGGGPTASGATGEPGGYDPLGTGAEPGDLTQRQIRRVETTVSMFVTAAYGYSGDDPGEYRKQLNQVLRSQRFYTSPAAEDVEAYENQVEDGGIQSAATLEDFEITDESPDEVEGVATFTMGQTYGDSGEVQGESATLYQELTLVPGGPTWRVDYGGPISDQSPTQQDGQGEGSDDS